MKRERFIIKVCGMRDPNNIAALSNTGVDWMGMIFYPKSKRFVSGMIEPDMEKKMQRVGVFVDEDIDNIEHFIKDYQLEIIQLHGSEDPGYCTNIKQLGVKVLKAFSVENSFDFSHCDPFIGHSDYFLFDTKGDLPGGNGVAFDWNILESYEGDTPFLISGGIDFHHVAALKKFQHPSWIGIDINSRFESEPAIKNIEKIKRFKHELFS